MQDPPSPALIEKIAKAVPPSEGGHPTFEARVAHAALQLVQRANELSAASDRAEQGRLATLLGQQGDLETLNRRLCERIRDGSLSRASPGLARHLRATALEKLAIDQPTYAAYKRALETPEA
jgi:hypothetical protein